PHSLGSPGNIDPQIAASNAYLVITASGKIWLFTKAGKLVKKDKKGNPIVNPISAMAFWRDAWFNPQNPPTLNDSLNLPADLYCDPSFDPFDGAPGPPGDQPLSAAQKAATADCYRRVYDTRVIFDDFRKRFWIISAVRNDQGTLVNRKALPPAQ